MIRIAYTAGDTGSIPESGRYPGVGNGNPLWYSFLENSMDRGAWQAMVHRVTKSQTQPKWLNTQIFSVQHFSFPRTRTCTLKMAFPFSLFTLSSYPIPIPISTLFKKLGTAKNEVYSFLESRKK